VGKYAQKILHYLITISIMHCVTGLKMLSKLFQKLRSIMETIDLQTVVKITHDSIFTLQRLSNVKYVKKLTNEPRKVKVADCSSATENFGIK